MTSIIIKYENIDEIKNMNNTEKEKINKIVFDTNDKINDSIIKLFPNLNTIIFKNKFVCIKNLIYCNKINKLSFDNYDGKLSNLDKCINLRELTLGNNFNNIIDDLLYCTNLEYLSFGKIYNQSIDSLQFCIKLKNLFFGDTFNQSIIILYNLINLELIHFGKYFNQPIDSLQFCSKLENIKFGYSFNYQIDTLKYCTKLKQIYLISTYNHSIDPLIYCNNLSIINIDYYGYDINNKILKKLYTLNRFYQKNILVNIYKCSFNFFNSHKTNLINVNKIKCPYGMTFNISEILKYN
jgi:hypothetical protein